MLGIEVHGGYPFQACLQIFLHALNEFSRVVVVWLNEYFGPVLRDGAGFADMPVCKKHANKLHGSVAIARRTADTFGRDMEEMISRKLTFDEAVKATDFTIMTSSAC